MSRPDDAVRVTSTRPGADLLDPAFYVGDPHPAYRWMRANELLKLPPSEAPPLTNEFLPGEGLGEDS